MQKILAKRVWQMAHSHGIMLSTGDENEIPKID